VSERLSGRNGVNFFHFLHHTRDGVIVRFVFLIWLHLEHEARRFSWSHHAPPRETGKM
jgi:ketosteroid isomerase-like protein